jgi:HEAT repeat protein
MGKSALPDLLDALHDKDGCFRQSILLSIEAMAEESDDGVLALAAVLKHEDEALRVRAVVVLGCMGQRAAPAVPALMAAREDPDESVRSAVAMALREPGMVTGAAPSGGPDRR